MNLLQSFAAGTFEFIYQVSPIWFTNGISSLVPGNIGLPISMITEGINSVNSLVANQKLPDQYFANFKPTAGSQLCKYEVAQYPFYTQQIAANAQIQQPVQVSMLMYCPAGASTPYSVKLGTMNALKASIDAHINSGGTFTVLTPSYYYTDCLLLGITDVSNDTTLQVQWAYQWDFLQPLITFPSLSGMTSPATTMSDNGMYFPATNGDVSWSGIWQQASSSVENFGYSVGNFAGGLFK